MFPASLMMTCWCVNCVGLNETQSFKLLNTTHANVLSVCSNTKISLSGPLRHSQPCKSAPPRCCKYFAQTFDSEVLLTRFYAADMAEQTDIFPTIISQIRECSSYEVALELCGVVLCLKQACNWWWKGAAFLPQYSVLREFVLHNLMDNFVQM